MKEFFRKGIPFTSRRPAEYQCQKHAKNAGNSGKKPVCELDVAHPKGKKRELISLAICGLRGFEGPIIQGENKNPKCKNQKEQ